MMHVLGISTMGTLRAAANEEWNVINERKEPAKAKAAYSAKHKGIGG
jgi:hypothetical protein